jgi:soluble lytic murein transglycosylase-like protein
MALALAGAFGIGIACGQAAAQDVATAAAQNAQSAASQTVAIQDEAKAAAQDVAQSAAQDVSTAAAQTIAAQNEAEAAARDVAESAAQEVIAAAAAVAGQSAKPDVSLVDETITIGERKVARWLVETVTRAAKVTGLDPAYVLALADKESSFDPDIRAPTSSAVGLFQFLEGTWLHVLSEHAAKHGYDEVAAAVEVVAGRPTVAPDARDWIMDLRRDPYLSALMACEMAKEASERLAKVTNGSVQDADLYLAHFLGAAGAARMLKLVETNPSKHAHAAFPQAAKANRSLFAAKGSKKKRKAATVAQVRDRINAMMVSRMERYASLSAGR